MSPSVTTRRESRGEAAAATCTAKAAYPVPCRRRRIRRSSKGHGELKRPEARPRLGAQNCSHAGQGPRSTCSTATSLAGSACVVDADASPGAQPQDPARLGRQGTGQLRGAGGHGHLALIVPQQAGRGVQHKPPGTPRLNRDEVAPLAQPAADEGGLHSRLQRLPGGLVRGGHCWRFSRRLGEQFGTFTRLRGKCLSALALKKYRFQCRSLYNCMRWSCATLMLS